MAWFSKIDRRIWGDKKFRRLSRPQPNAQTLWLYILTGRHVSNIPGLWIVGEASLAEALGWEVKPFRERFRELFEMGMVKADWDAHVLWVPNAIKYNRPDNPNQIRGMKEQWDLIPECDLKDEAYLVLKKALATTPEAEHSFHFACGNRLGNGSLNGSGNRSGNGSGNKEKEKEKEKESEKEKEGEAAAPADTHTSSEAEEEEGSRLSRGLPGAVGVLTFPCKGGKTWNLTPAVIAELESDFPTVDVLASARAALAHLRSSADKPTAGKLREFDGMQVWLAKWLARDADWGKNLKARGGAHEATPPSPKPVAGALAIFAEACRNQLGPGTDAYAEWAARHAARFSYLRPDDPTIVGRWQEQFQRIEATVDELEEASFALAKRKRPDRPPSRRKDLEALLGIIQDSRDRRARQSPPPSVNDSSVCMGCDGGGVLNLPDPNCVHAGKWGPPWKTIRVLCTCFSQSAHGTEPTDAMGPFSYGAKNPKWKEQLASHRLALATARKGDACET